MSQNGLIAKTENKNKVKFCHISFVLKRKIEIIWIWKQTEIQEH